MEPKQTDAIKSMLTLHEALLNLIDSGFIYGIHRWGIQLSEGAYTVLFGDTGDTGGNRLSTIVNGVEFFALREDIDG